VIVGILVRLAEACLSPAIAATIRGWLKPKPPEDGYQAIRKADQAAAKTSTESTDADPNRLPPNP